MGDGAACWLLRDPGGALLGSGRDGVIALASVCGADFVPLLAVSTGPGHDCLAQAPGMAISDNDPTPVQVHAWRGALSGGLTSFGDEDGRPLRLDEGGKVGFGEPGTAATGLIVEPCAAVPAGALLGALPADFSFDSEGLAAVIRTGSRALLPVAQALLKLLDAAQARRAWTLHPRGPAQDLFHAAVCEHGQQRLSRFSSYTADILRAQAAEHGWQIGEKTYGRPVLMEVGRGKLTIGRFCSMADPTIILGNHSTRSATSYPFLDMWTEWPGTTIDLSDHTARDVAIGNDVWIGVNAIILPGAVIGDGAVIGAGTVVRGTVPPYAICIGNPGRIERYRCDQATASRLLRIRWWDWPDGRIDRYIPWLLSRDIEGFLAQAEAEAGIIHEVPA